MGLLDRLLAKGRFGAELRAELEAERIVLLAEAIQATVGGEGLRAARIPKGRALAALALTQQRLVLAVMGEPLVDVTWDGGRARELDLAADERGLRIGFATAVVRESVDGHVDVLLRLPDPQAIMAAIEQRRRPLDPRRHVRE